MSSEVFQQLQVSVEMILYYIQHHSESFGVCMFFLCRSAARCNKGIEVLLAVALEHFVLVVVRVLRGPSPADDSAKKIRYLIHCQWCEERIFQKEGNMVEGKQVFLVTFLNI